MLPEETVSGPEGSSLLSSTCPEELASRRLSMPVNYSHISKAVIRVVRARMITENEYVPHHSGFHPPVSLISHSSLSLTHLHEYAHVCACVYACVHVYAYTWVRLHHDSNTHLRNLCSTC